MYVILSMPDSDDFTAYCLILPMLGIGPQWWIDSHNIHHVVCNDVHCGEFTERPRKLFVHARCWFFYVSWKRDKRVSSVGLFRECLPACPLKERENVGGEILVRSSTKETLYILHTYIHT